MNWEIGIDMYTLMCIKWMTNKNLLCKKINKKEKKEKKNPPPKGKLGRSERVAWTYIHYQM